MTKEEEVLDLITKVSTQQKEEKNKDESAEKQRVVKFTDLFQKIKNSIAKGIKIVVRLKTMPHSSMPLGKDFYVSFSDSIIEYSSVGDIKLLQESIPNGKFDLQYNWRLLEPEVAARLFNYEQFLETSIRELKGLS